MLVGLGRNPRFPHLIDELTTDVLWLLAPDGDWDNEIEPISPRKPGSKPGKGSGKKTRQENWQISAENEYDSGLDGFFELLKFIPKYRYGGSSRLRKVKPTPGKPVQKGTAGKLGKPGKSAKPGSRLENRGQATGGEKPGTIKPGAQPVKSEWGTPGKSGKKGPAKSSPGGKPRHGKPTPGDVALETNNEKSRFDFTGNGYASNSQYGGLRYGYSGDEGRFDIPISELGDAEGGEYSVWSGKDKQLFAQSGSSESASGVATAGNSNSGNSAASAASAFSSDSGSASNSADDAETGSAATSATSSAAASATSSAATSATSSAAASATSSAAASAASSITGAASNTDASSATSSAAASSTTSAEESIMESEWEFGNGNAAGKGTGGRTGYGYRFRGGKGVDGKTGYGYGINGREYGYDEAGNGSGSTTNDGESATNSGRKSESKSIDRVESGDSQKSAAASSAAAAASAITYKSKSGWGSNDETYEDEGETGAGFVPGSAYETGKWSSSKGNNEGLSQTTSTATEKTASRPNYGSDDEESQSVSSATSAATASASSTGTDDTGYGSGYGVGLGTIPGSEYRTEKGVGFDTGYGSAYRVGYGGRNEVQNAFIDATTANYDSLIIIEPGAKSSGPQSSASATSSAIASSSTGSEGKSGLEYGDTGFGTGGVNGYKFIYGEPRLEFNYRAKNSGSQSSAAAASSAAAVSTSESEKRTELAPESNGYEYGSGKSFTTGNDASLNEPGNTPGLDYGTNYAPGNGNGGSQASASTASASAGSAAETGSIRAVPYRPGEGFGRYGPVYGTGNRFRIGNRYGSGYGTGKSSGLESGYGIGPQSSPNLSRSGGAIAMDPSLGTGYRTMSGGGIQNSASSAASAVATGFGNKSGFGTGDQTIYRFGDGTGTGAAFRPGLASRFPNVGPGWNGYGVANGVNSGANYGNLYKAGTGTQGLQGLVNAGSFPGYQGNRVVGMPGFAQPQEIPGYSTYGANNGGISNAQDLVT